MNINRIVRRVIALIILVALVGYVLGFMSGRSFGKAEEARAEEINQVEEEIDEIEILRELEEYVPIEEPEEEVIEEIELETLGTFTITHYCSCSKCCGIYAQNRPKDEDGNEIVYTASGERAIANYTVAVDTSVIPMGTHLLIDGIEYEAMDTGSFHGHVIDIYTNDHEAALNGGCYESEVFLIGY